jgi:Tfp pilus assembly protein PilF/TolB-like protein
MSSRNWLRVVAGCLLLCSARQLWAAPTPERPVVAILPFTDNTHKSQAHFWCYTIHLAVRACLWHAKEIRLMEEEAADYGMRSERLHPGQPVSLAAAQRIGQRIQVPHIILGDYMQAGRKWRVRARVLNCATGKAGPELSAESSDWQEIVTRLSSSLLAQLRIHPTAAERAQIDRRSTTSQEAFELYCRAYALQQQQRPLAEQESLLHKVIQADPKWAKGYEALAGLCLNQEKTAEGYRYLTQALKLAPLGDSRAQTLLGHYDLAILNKPGEAEQQLVKALHSDPDNPEIQALLANIYASQEHWDAALDAELKAVQLDGANASYHAAAGYFYVNRLDKPHALTELQMADRLDAEDINAHDMAANAYEQLGQIPLALDHYKRIVALARRQGMRPSMVKELEEHCKQLALQLTPTYLNIAMPAIYTPETLENAIRNVQLTSQERSLLMNPLESSPQIKTWAQKITAGATSDLERAQRLYDVMQQRLGSRDAGGTRTALATFAVWDKPEVSLWCQEYTRLYVAAAREVGLKAFVTNVARDASGRYIRHACAAVFIDGKALLVDPTLRWFGAPYLEYQVLDDFQTIGWYAAIQAADKEDLALARIAYKLSPGIEYGRFVLVCCLIEARQNEEAQKQIDGFAGHWLDPWRDPYLRGLLAFTESRFDEAARHIKQAILTNPDEAMLHLVMADTFVVLNRPKEAKTEYQTCIACSWERTLTQRAQMELLALDTISSTLKRGR